MLQQEQRYEQDYDEIPESEIETRYVYIFDEDPEQRRWKWPTFDRSRLGNLFMQALALVLLAGFCTVQGQPNYHIQTITVPALLLPVQHFSASAPIVATGVKSIPATRARGWLTITNGSSLIETIPAGFMVESASGAQIATDQSVTVPASDGESFGKALVAAHAVVAGMRGNIAAHSLNTTEGTSLYLKNLAAFTGGQDARTIPVVQESDREAAITEAKAQVEAEKPTSGVLARPCRETMQQENEQVTARLACQYVTYTVPAQVQVLSVLQVQGSSIVLRIKEAILPQ